jgi:hypothetical protein
MVDFPPKGGYEGTDDASALRAAAVVLLFGLIQKQILAGPQIRKVERRDEPQLESRIRGQQGARAWCGCAVAPRLVRQQHTVFLFRLRAHSGSERQ